MPTIKFSARSASTPGVITYENQYKEKGHFLPEHGFRAAKGRGERGWNYADLDLYLDPNQALCESKNRISTK